MVRPRLFIAIYKMYQHICKYIQNAHKRYKEKYQPAGPARSGLAQMAPTYLFIYIYIYIFVYLYTIFHVIKVWLVF